MTTDNTTPRPWKVKATNHDTLYEIEEFTRRIGSKYGEYAGGPAPGAAFEAEHQANAKLLERAVNHHDDLVAALRSVVENVIADHPLPNPDIPYLRAARDVLARATEGE